MDPRRDTVAERGRLRECGNVHDWGRQGAFPEDGGARRRGCRRPGILDIVHETCPAPAVSIGGTGPMGNNGEDKREQRMELRVWMNTERDVPSRGSALSLKAY